MKSISHFNPELDPVHSTATLAAAASVTTPTNKKRPWYRPVTIILNYLIEQWFILGLGVVVVLAWRWPQVAKDGGSEPCHGLKFEVRIGWLLMGFVGCNRLWLLSLFWN